MDLSDKTDKEIEQILIEGAYNQGVRTVQAAQLEIERRRSDRLYTQQKKSAEILETTLTHLQKVAVLQEEISKTTATQLHRIIKILDKPVWLVIFASIWGIL